MRPDFWLDKPYYSLDAYCKQTYAHKCYKIALNAHMTCPNRDGSLGTRGCIFCSNGGSGEFAVTIPGVTSCTGTEAEMLPDLSSQIAAGLSLFGDKKTGNHFIAYFQAYTNTYGPVNYLEAVYSLALSHPSVCGISIATRPDCLSEEVLSLLSRLKTAYPDKFIWVELGLQTIHEDTARYIRRGYDLSVFDKAMDDLKKISVPVIVHMILGLPGETKDMILQTIDYINHKHPFGVKLQLLHVLKDTDLASDYEAGKFKVYTKDEYLDLLIRCIENLSPEIVIHRVTGDGPKDLLIAPTWSLNKRDVLNSLHKQMKFSHSFQGKQYHCENMS